MSAAEASAARVFCTLFDSGYLSRGLAMYESLARRCREFTLYVFPFDDRALRTLEALALPNVVIVPLKEFEDQELLRVKPTRSGAEYCWTCTASTVLYVMERFGHAVCTYLDADIHFHASPDPLLEELGADDVLITEHRFSPQNDLSATSGIYCVQFVTFRNSERGRKALRWWREACLESCELNPAAGKCGDQKYLDDWPQRFEGVHVLAHLGGGLAPWNVQQYRFDERAPHTGTQIASGRRFEPVFFHFHGLKLSTGGRVRLTGTSYELSTGVVEIFYRPYLRHLDDIGRRLAARGIEFDPHGRIADGPPGALERAGHLAERAFSRLRHFGVLGGNRNVPYFLDELV
ncbi:MAG: hypothetical protein WAO95_00990 [Burkholderiales bacterium]